MTEATHTTRTSIVVTPHEVLVRINGAPHLMLRRSEIVGVQGYIKNIGPVVPIHFVEVTTRTGQIVSDYADRSLWEEVLNGLAEARQQQVEGYACRWDWIREVAPNETSAIFAHSPRALLDLDEALKV